MKDCFASQVKEAEAIENQMRAKGPGGPQPPQPGQQPQYPGGNWHPVFIWLSQPDAAEYVDTVPNFPLSRSRGAAPVWWSTSRGRLPTSAPGLLSASAPATAGKKVAHVACKKITCDNEHIIKINLVVRGLYPSLKPQVSLS